MAYIVKFRGNIVAGPFAFQGDAIQASIQKAKECNNIYRVSEFKVERI